MVIIMKTPFEILNVPEDADDEQIKSAYLEAVKRWPPERHAVEFQRVRNAYERIATRKDRVSYLLFDSSLPEPAGLLDFLLEQRCGGRPDIRERLRGLLQQGVEEAARNFEL